MNSWFKQPEKWLVYRQRVAIILVVLGALGLGYFLWWTLAWGSWGWPWCSNQVLATNLQPLDDEKAWVQVAGAVEKPGVYRLESGALLADALAAAGGLGKGADLRFVDQQLNLAHEVENNSKLYIPSIEESKFLEDAASWCAENTGLGSNPKDETSQISLNSASQSELESLPGIGAVRAKAIIEGRPYHNLEEVVSRGILGEGLWAEIKELVVL